MGAALSAVGTAMRLTWTAASRPLVPGEPCGDLDLVLPVDGGYLLMVADGLGHGPEAQAASRRAVSAAATAAGPSPAAVLEACHAACVGTRGVVMTIAFADLAAGVVRWAGVGNVDAVHLRPSGGRPPRPALMLPGGVVGSAMPRLREQELDLMTGDVLVMATDGIGPSFAADLALLAAPRTDAADVLEAHGIDDDDALVLLARCEAWR